MELRAPRPFSLILAGRGRPALHGLRRRYKIGAKDGVDPQVAASNLYPSVQDEVARIAGSPEVRSAFDRFRSRESQFALWQMEATRVAAPPFRDAARGTGLADPFCAPRLS